MESAGGSSGAITAVSAAMPSPSSVADTTKATKYEFDPSIAEEERRFYLKAYPTVDTVRDRKTHCTVCKTHIGTAPVQENGIKMHPILRVTHCNKCHDFYNSGEFSKGEDGSELYCRWCGQGGEVYCCSSCPYVFCKSCIVKNLSRGVVADIEQNENWNCFSCAPKILWPLRAQHWALMNYIEQQKMEIYAMNLSEAEQKQYLSRDVSKCCRLAKAKCGNMSDSMESLDSVNSKRSHASAGSAKKPMKHAASPQQQGNSAKRPKTNDDIVCTPDLLSMLEPDCQITVSPKPNRPMQSPSTSTPKIMSVQQQGNYSGQMSSTPKNSVPPPLVLRNTAIKLRPAAPQPVVRRTIIGPRTPAPGGNGAPVYHTINGYRIDLNSAAQQETFRLPNGKLIQVKRQGPPAQQNAAQVSPSPNNNWQQMNSPQPQRMIPQTIASRAVQITPHPYNITIQQQQQQQQGGQPQVVRQYHNMIGSTSISTVSHNGTAIQVLNGQMNAQPQHQQQQQQQHHPQQQQPQQVGGPIRPVMIRHVFPDTPIGQARTGLQEQVFNAMEICTHLTNKVQTLTNSNAYKQARNYLEVKELYIHLSYLLTYAIGRFKGLQDKCLGDMRTLGFGNDADSLENGQLAAAVDYVCYGQLDDVDLFNTGSNSFHNQVYEYRKSLHANLKDGEDGAKSPLPPLFPLGQGKTDEDDDPDADGEDSLLENPKGNLKGHWLEGGEDSPVPTGYNQENEENEEPDENFMDYDDDDTFNRDSTRGPDGFMQGTEESMRRNEETHAFDRKLTRLVAQYPSIWCTRHPDYGNFEVTRKQWRIIQLHFDRNEQIKLRWKNIRKRFVRIEKRIAEGKRFNGHFDKAMAFLANRNLSEDKWVQVDCGEDDGDTYERYNLDAIEQSLHLQGKDEFVDRTNRDRDGNERNLFSFQPAIKPIEIEPLDLKIMTFVKSNPVLWRKSMDPEADKIDEQTRKTVWNQLQRSMPQVSGDYIKDRWLHLYEMYKTFRLKTIKSNDDRSNLELKYSKYLAKLYFLYKIDEEELRNENNGLFEDCFELEEDEEDAEREAEEQEDEGLDSASPKDSPIKLQDMPDDKEFLLQLVKSVHEYPAIWNTQHDDYNDIMIRDNYWQEINEKLQDFKHKQASDDEDNEIEIVEPKTDLINLDSDDDEPPHTSPIKTVKQVTPVKINKNFNPNTSNSSDVKVRAGIPAASISPANKMATIRPILAPPAVVAQPPPSPAATAADENMDLMSMAQSFLASMLEVDIHEGPFYPGGSDAALKKQPRKKLTNKPNPTLLKQKAIMERERLEELKRNDQKLKMKCAVALKKAEEEFPYAKEMLEAKLKEDERKEKERKEQEAQNKLLVETGKKIFEVEVVIEDSPTKEKNNDKELSGDESGDEAEKKTEKSKDKVIKTMEISDEEEKENSIDKSETEKENSIAKEKEKTAAEEDKPEDVTDDEQEKSKVETKENSVEITDNGKDSSVEVIDDEKDKSVEALNNDTDKSVEVLDKDGDETDMEEDIDEITDKEKSLETKDEEKEKSKETKDEEKEKSIETKDEEKEKSIETKDEVKDESMEHEDKDNEKSMEVENIDKDEVVEDIDEKENNKTEKIKDKSDEILEPLTEESEQTTIDKVENEDKIDNNKTNGINEKDKVEDKDEEMETDENNKTENEITDETMEIDDKESPQESNIPEAIEEKNTVAELVVDKEIEQVLQKLPAEDDDNVLLENKDEKIISDNDEEESILPDDSAVHTTADSVITSSSEVVTEKVLPSVEPANETPPIEATTTATTTTTTTPSNDNVVF